eukprot:PhM_4_TR11675/c3_g1_i1/m.13382
MTLAAAVALPAMISSGDFHDIRTSTLNTPSLLQSLDSNNAAAMDGEDIGDDGTNTAPTTPTPTSNQLTTASWCRHPCPWTGSDIAAPPTWTHERTSYLSGTRVVTVLRDPTRSDVAVHVTSTRILSSNDDNTVFSSVLSDVRNLPGLVSCIIESDDGTTHIKKSGNNHHDHIVSYVVETLPDGLHRLEGYRALRRTSLRCHHVFDVVLCAPSDMYFQYGWVGHHIMKSFSM